MDWRFGSPREDVLQCAGGGETEIITSESSKPSDIL